MARGGFVVQQKREGRRCSIEGRARAAARAGEGEGRGTGSGIDGQRRRHGVVAELSSLGGVIDGEEGQQQGRLDGTGRKVSGIALMAGQQARRAAAQRARARVPCRERREEERGERKREEREKERSTI